MKKIINLLFWAIVSNVSIIVVAAEEPESDAFIHPEVQTVFPRLFIGIEDRDALIDKVEGVPWAARVYANLKERVDPFVDRHVEDPYWLLGRFQMHWGQHFTFFPVRSDSGDLDMERRSGNAPVPTVRVHSVAGNSMFSDGFTPAVCPSDIADFPCFVEGDTFQMEHTKRAGEYEEVGYGYNGQNMNRAISMMAADSAILYFISGDEKYAKLSCDILMQWMLGIYFQNPYNRPYERRTYTAFVGGQDLNDDNYRGMAVIYDLCHDYLQRHSEYYLSGQFYRDKDVDREQLSAEMAGMDLVELADEVFYKFVYYGCIQNSFSRSVGGVAKDDLERDFPVELGGFNNHGMKCSMLIWHALVINDKEKREDLLTRFLYENDFVHKVWQWNGIVWRGQYPWKNYFKGAVNESGFWMEPPGYHSFPMLAAIRQAAPLERAGYDIWNTFPQLLKSTFAQYRITFPNMNLAEWGDSSLSVNSSMDGAMLAGGATGAYLIGHEEGPRLSAYLNKLVDTGIWDRSQIQPEQLLYILDDLPEPSGPVPVRSRSDFIDYSGFMIQRNQGEDKENGMMFTVNHSYSVHTHYKNMDFAYYGRGHVLASHSGVLYPYGRKEMLEYYVRGGAANTVIPNMVAIPRNTDRKPAMEIEACEPSPGQIAVSENCQFSDTSLDYVWTTPATKQRRTVGIVRTSEESGYYIDIFRSDNASQNDYLFHHRGSDLDILDAKSDSVKMETTNLLSRKTEDERTNPGYEYFSDVYKSEIVDESVRANFRFSDEENGDVVSRVFFPSNVERTYFSGRSPLVVRGTSEPEKSRSLLLARQHGDAWEHPFVAVFEPVRDGDGLVESVDILESQNGLVVVSVTGRDSRQLIFSSVHPDVNWSFGGVEFVGTYGVVGFSANDDLQYLYLGKGRHIAYGEVEIDLPTSGSKEVRVGDH